MGPCRVDLAGGTLDIWPLGQLFSDAATISVAIDLQVETTVRLGGAGYRVRLGEETFCAASPQQLAATPRTALIGTVLAALAMPPGEVEVRSASPLGAGLGASSTLTLTLLAACHAAAGRPQPADRVQLARDLEARLMRLPTGVQDHLTAEAGGVVAIEHRAGGPVACRLEVALDELSRRLLVVYSGRSHMSAASNWEVLRACLDGDPVVHAALAGIGAVAARIPLALGESDWETVGALMRQEWLHRRQLGRGVATPEIEALLELAQESGAHGGKVCGAGGGGCIAVLCPPSRRGSVADRLSRAGGLLLAAKPTERGLVVGPAAARG